MGPQRGHGRSDHGRPETWNLATWAADVQGLADALGIDRPVVLGVSFGGFVAQQEAARIRTMEVNRHFMAELKAMDLRDRLCEVRCPTLVIIGEHDPLVPTHLGQEIVDAIPDDLARLELVGDASHEVVVDNPEESYRLVREFLAEIG